MRYNKEERFKYIIDNINLKNVLQVTDLAEILNVSEVTIRKDLKELEDKKKLHRVYGGATNIKSSIKKSRYEERRNKNTKDKKSLAQIASTFINNNMNIFLDAGTTTKEIIPYLENTHGIYVITYDVEIAYLLSKYNNVTTYILGGEIENRTYSTLSIDTVERISKFRADLVFVGTDAFDNEYAYSTNDIRSNIKTRMIENSRLKVLVADSSKYGYRGLTAFSSLNNFDYVITDRIHLDINDLTENDANKDVMFLTV